MAPYDPVLEAYKAQGIPEHAVGTLDELQKSGMPAKAFHSCNEPAVDGSIRGCPLWHICTMDYKGKTVAEGGGPRMHCWERIKSPAQGGAVVRNSQPCYWGVAQQENAQANKEILRVIKDEGEDYVTLTSVPKPKASDPFNREIEEVKFTVPEYPRLGQEKKVKMALQRAELIKQERERLSRERAAETFGIEGASTPLNKRGGRGGKGGAKED